MTEPIILVAETGSDITPAVAEANGIVLVPMHVSFGSETLDDGTFPASEICAYYERTHQVPKTSGSTPGDFEAVFTRIRAEYPTAPILHLAYSACTTCSYQSALTAAEEFEGIRSVDVKHVSVGQYAVVLEVARQLKAHPEYTLEEAASLAQRVCEQVRMCFMPHDLTFLRAGGRVSNAAAIMGALLRIRPCIEILDGKLIATKKYRGPDKRCLSQMIADFMGAHRFRHDKLYLIRSVGFSDELAAFCSEELTKLGYTNTEWVETGCVITTHGGPHAFGIVGYEED